MAKTTVKVEIPLAEEEEPPFPAVTFIARSPKKKLSRPEKIPLLCEWVSITNENKVEKCTNATPNKEKFCDEHNTLMQHKTKKVSQETKTFVKEKSKKLSSENKTNTLKDKIKTSKDKSYLCVPDKIIVKPEQVLFYTWQQELWHKLKAPDWDYRRLMWIVGKRGLEGKSIFCSTFVSVNGGIHLKSMAGSNNLSSLISEETKFHQTVNYIFLDLPRSDKGCNIWGTLESLLNGDEYILKYRKYSQEKTIPRIVVFSNWDPPFDVDRYKQEFDIDKVISLDRWLIGHIEGHTNLRDKQVDNIIVWEPNPFHDPYWKPPSRVLEFE
jgi:hypothetical protein